MSQWIGGEFSDYTVGQVGFLVLVSPEQRADRYDLRDSPPHTNQSHEPRLNGWCGTTDNVAVYGRGMARVVRVARNGRALVVPLEGEDLRAALDTLGYPELMPD